MELDPVTNEASVLVRAVQCESVTVGTGNGRKAEFVTFRVSLLDPDPTHPPPPGYVPLGHAYTLWFASDNRDTVEYYREHGDVPHRAAAYDRELSIKMPGEHGSGQLKVDAPSAPSPFEMQATVEPLDVVALNGAVDFWAKVPTGTMVQRQDTLDALQLGEVTDGELKPAPGSEMDRVFCGLTRTRGAVRFGRRRRSLRRYFRRGSFAVAVDGERQLSETSSATCTTV